MFNLYRQINRQKNHYSEDKLRRATTSLTENLNNMTHEDYWGDNCFYCDTCGQRFRSPLYDVSKEYERTIFYEEPLLPEIEIIGAETVAYFCSPSCRDKKRDHLLIQEKIRATYPGIGPVEPCSRCGAPVDKTNYHLTYIEMDTTQDWDRALFGVEVIKDPVNLAVVCQKCEPMPRQIKAAIEQDEPDFEPTQPAPNRGSPKKTKAEG